MYLDGSYLANPRDMNGVPSMRVGSPTEAVNSVADQYLLRAGAQAMVPGVPGLGLSLGGRLDGVPVRDLLGESHGFRRPGLSLALEPGVSVMVGSTTLGLELGVPFYRNRLASLADLENGTHGDAAFADYLVSARVSHVFGGP